MNPRERETLQGLRDCVISTFDKDFYDSVQRHPGLGHSAWRKSAETLHQRILERLSGRGDSIFLAREGGAILCDTTELYILRILRCYAGLMGFSETRFSTDHTGKVFLNETKGYHYPDEQVHVNGLSGILDTISKINYEKTRSAPCKWRGGRFYLQSGGTACRSADNSFLAVLVAEESQQRLLYSL